MITAPELLGESSEVLARIAPGAPNRVAATPTAFNLWQINGKSLWESQRIDSMMTNHELDSRYEVVYTSESPICNINLKKILTTISQEHLIISQYLYLYMNR